MRLTLRDCHKIENPMRDPALIGLVMTPSVNILRWAHHAKVYHVASGTSVCVIIIYDSKLYLS